MEEDIKEDIDQSQDPDETVEGQIKLDHWIAQRPTEAVKVTH